MSAVKMLASAAGAAVLGGGLMLGAAGVAAADPIQVAPALLNTDCSRDQLMAATKVVDRPVYDEVIDKYNTESPWIQDHFKYHFDLLLEKNPADRQGEIEELATFFPQYVGFFQMNMDSANAVTAQCHNYPVQDPAVWNPQAATPAAPAAPADDAADAAPAADDVDPAVADAVDEALATPGQ